MKFMRSAFVVLALAPAALFGANKEMVQLQRDVALLQDDVRTLQRSLDEKMSAAANAGGTDVSCGCEIGYFRGRSRKWDS